MTPEEKIILIVFVAAVAIFVVYFELRIMRSKGKESRKSALEKDEAYNAVLTTRSVTVALQSQGVDTSKAQRIVDEAKLAMQRGDYQTCKDLCDRAKVELTNPSENDAPRRTRALKAAPRDEAVNDKDALMRMADEINDSRRQEGASDKYSGTKLGPAADGNYMSAKFELNTATVAIHKAREKGQETSVAAGILADAEKAFSAGSYTKALSLAVKSRKSINALPDDEAIKLKKTSAVREETDEGELEETEVEEPGECETCGAPLEEDDAFCHKCGAKVAYEKECGGCGATAKPNDAFCRKCGSRLD